MIVAYYPEDAEVVAYFCASSRFCGSYTDMFIEADLQCTGYYQIALAYEEAEEKDLKKHRDQCYNPEDLSWEFEYAEYYCSLENL